MTSRLFFNFSLKVQYITMFQYFSWLHGMKQVLVENGLRKKRTRCLIHKAHLHFLRNFWEFSHAKYSIHPKAGPSVIRMAISRTLFDSGYRMSRLDRFYSIYIWNGLGLDHLKPGHKSLGFEWSKPRPFYYKENISYDPLLI